MSKTVGIRELKTHLSQYVKEVKDGAEIFVSERGSVVARIVSVEPHSETNRFQNLLLDMSAKGKIILPGLPKKSTTPPKRIKVKGTSFADAVIEDRR